MDYGRILKRALKNGGEFADIFIERSTPLSIVCEDDRIEKVLSGVESGAGVRLVFGTRSAYAYTNEVTTESLLALADAVSAAARDAGEGVRTVDLARKDPSITFRIERDPRGTGTAEKVALVASANRVARSFDPRIWQVMVVYRENLQQVTVARSDGYIAEDERTYLTALVHVVASDGGVIQTGYEPVGGLFGMELFDHSPLENAARTASRRAVTMLTARKAPAGRMPVVLSSEAGGTMIHEAVGHGLEADLAQSALSVYSGKIGQRIAAPLITVLDDATLPGRRGSFRFDDEGTASTHKVRWLQYSNTKVQREVGFLRCPALVLPQMLRGIAR